MSTFLKPKRKRGYYRALKRREPWAVSEQAFRSLRDDITKAFYSQSIHNPPTPKIIGLKEWLDEES